MGRGWPGRIEYGGTYDQNWIDNVFPFLPADFDDRYYQMAPPDQQTDPPAGRRGGHPRQPHPRGNARTSACPPPRLPVTLFKGRDIALRGRRSTPTPCSSTPRTAASPSSGASPPASTAPSSTSPRPGSARRPSRCCAPAARAAPTSAPPAPPSPRTRTHDRELDIVSIGMVTAVGLDAPSACAAMRARLDGFQETRFLGPGGDWLVGAPGAAAAQLDRREAPRPHGRRRDRRGLRRRARGPRPTAALILCLAEEDRPGRLAPDAPRLPPASPRSSASPPDRTRIVAHGRPSGHVALDQARKLARRPATAPYVMIAGVDSYLTARRSPTTSPQDRLLAPDNPNGFIPGEAAAAILCARPGAGALRLLGLGLAREPAHIYNGRPTCRSAATA